MSQPFRRIIEKTQFMASEMVRLPALYKVKLSCGHKTQCTLDQLIVGGDRLECEFCPPEAEK